MKPTIAILGATGKAGHYIVTTLIQQGYPVKILLRNPDKWTLSSPHVHIIKGDALNEADILALLQSSDFVISAIGQPGNPFPVFSKATTNIIKAMALTAVQRYFVITGLSIDVPGDNKSERVQQLSAWMRQTYPELIADKQQEYQLLAASNIAWTIVRLPVIEQTGHRYPLSVSLTDCPGDKISATDLAHFLISQLNSDAFLQKAPFIANRQPD